MRTVFLLFCAVSLLRAEGSGLIEGKVTNAITHEPIAGVQVTAQSGWGRTEIKVLATTDVDGSFTTPELKPASYYVIFEADGYVGSSSKDLDVSTAAVKCNAELMPGASIRGRVLDDDSHPASEIGVEIYGYRRGMPSLFKTDRDGRFHLPGLASGVYAIAARPAATPKDGTELSPTWFPSFTDRRLAERIIVRPGAELSGYEIRLRRVPVRRLQGVALDQDSKPLAGASIQLVLAEGWQRAAATVTSGKDGVFEFPSVRPGEWLLEASAAGSREGSATVTVDKHDIDDVKVRLSLPFTLQGFVDREEPRDAQGKRQVTSVFLLPVGGEGKQTTEFHKQDGTLEFRAVQPGRYRISPSGYIPGYYVDSVKFGDREVMPGASVEIRNGAFPIRITYEPNASRVRANVEKGKGSTVVLVPQDESMWDLQFIRSAKCDGNGRVEVGSLKPGEYYAFAFDRIAVDALEDVTFVRGLRPLAVPVHVDAGQAAEVELKVTLWPE